MSTLGGNGESEPLPESWANRSTQPRVGRIGGPSTAAPQPSGPGRMATLRDLAQPSGGHGGHGHGGAGRGRPRDDDDSEDDDVPQNFFAGGERSGLSVENPNHARRGGAENQVREILRRAAEGSRQVQDRERTRGPFVGAGHTLGSDETPGQTIPDPDTEEEDQEVAVRNITFWRTGFTIMDGPLQSYNDPDSAQLLELIQQGLAPPEVLNVRRGQPVELNIAKRLNEDYVPPPPGPFAGSGNRLGSPVPAATTSAPAPSTSTRPVTQGSNTAGGSAEPVKFEVDMTAPTTSIQIRLADGTRIVCRMNLTHTVGDIRRHINASRPGTSSRPYTIQTTLPVKVLNDEAQTIDEAGLKNSVVVQRWS